MLSIGPEHGDNFVSELTGYRTSECKEYRTQV